MKEKFHIALFCLILGGFGFLTQVRADTVAASYINDTSLMVQLNFNYAGQSYTNYAGQLQWVRTDTPGTGGAASTDFVPVHFSSYCADVTRNVIFPGSNTFVLSNIYSSSTIIPSAGGSPLGSVKADALAELWDAYYGSSTSPASGLTAAQNSASFAMAVYEITHESLVNGAVAFNLASGQFTLADTPAQDPIVQRATFMWTHRNDNAHQNLGNLLAMIGDSSQDQLINLPFNPGQPPNVPLPASVWGGIALMGLLASSKLIRKSKTA